jgi:hypothetical protein
MNVLLVTPENRFIRAFRRHQRNDFAQLTTAHLAAYVRHPHTVALADEYVAPIGSSPVRRSSRACAAPASGRSSRWC